MKTIIKVNHLDEKNQNKITEIEIDDASTIKHVSINELTTIGEYYSLLSATEKFHFSARKLMRYSTQTKAFFTDQELEFFHSSAHYLQLKFEIINDPNDESKYIVMHSTNQEQIEKFIFFYRGALPDEDKQAVVVRFLDGLVNMLGISVVDRRTQAALNGNTRYSLQAGPYTSVKAGASIVPIFSTPAGIKLAMVQNRLRDNKRTLQQQNAYPATWEFTGGYMDPIPLKGGEKGIFKEDKGKIVDPSEVLVIKGAYPEQAYTEVKALTMTKGTYAAPSQEKHHKYIIDTVEAELEEEVGLTKKDEATESEKELGITKIAIKKIREVYWRQEISPLPTMASVSYAEINSIDGINPYPLKPQDTNEIARAQWIDGKDIYFKDGIFYNDFIDSEREKHAVEITLKHALMGGKCLRAFRDDEIKTASQLKGTSLFSERQNVIAKIEQTLQSPTLNKNKLQIKDILGPSPEEILKEKVQQSEKKVMPGSNADEQEALAHLCKEAEDYHQRMIRVVNAFVKASAYKLFNADELRATAEGKTSVTLTASKAALFSVPSIVQTHTKDDLKPRLTKSCNM